MDSVEAGAAKERARLAELYLYEVLDTVPEAAFDRITTLAARLLRTPVALVSLVAADRQWFKSRVGLNACQTDREVSFCTHVVASDAPLVVPDARLDPRFATSPLVTGGAGVRFYAGAPLRSPHGHVLGTLCVNDSIPRPDLGQDDWRTLADLAALVVDELELRRTRRAFEASEQRYRSMTESAIDAILCADSVGRIVLANAAAERMFGYGAGGLAGQALDVIVPERLRGAHVAGMARLATGAAPRIMGRTVEVPALRRDGTELPVEVSLHRWRQDGTDFYGAMFRDLTERRRDEARIRHLAHHDSLTGLANRELFGIRLREAAAATRSGGPGCAVALLDLDRFKEVNDRHGHGTGDALLCQAAARLGACLGEGGTAARLGGDEFALLLAPLAPGPAAVVPTMVELAVEALSRPFVVDGQELIVGVSAGIALCPTHGDEADALLRNANLALRRAKDERLGRPFLFELVMGTAARARRALRDELRLAAARDEFRLRYQPQVCLASGRVVGVEALLRWQHPRRGLLSPGDFLDELEPAGIAAAVGTWVLREACAQARRWRDAGLSGLRVGVNLSAAQFRDPAGFAGLVLGTVAEHGLDPALLELEITEGTYLGHGEAVAGPLRTLRERGVRVSFDDFGTGYASLSYLKGFPLDRLKIDRSFVRDIASDPNDAAIVRSIIGLARNLDLEVIAEGVETAKQEAFLRRYDCAEAQGYRYGRPLPAEAIPPLALSRGVPGTAAADAPDGSGAPGPKPRGVDILDFRSSDSPGANGHAREVAVRRARSAVTRAATASVPKNGALSA